MKNKNNIISAVISEKKQKLLSRTFFALLTKEFTDLWRFGIIINFIFLFFFLIIYVLLNISSSFGTHHTPIGSLDIQNLPSQNELYMPRKELIKAIQTNLEKKEASSKQVALLGMAGMGKTQLAKEYAHAYSGNYNIVWWMDANQDLFSQLRELASKLRTVSCDMPDHNETSQVRWMEGIKACCDQLSLKALFIIDDVKQPKQIQAIDPYLQNIHVLFTSRNNSIGKNKMYLKGFTREESLNYLNKALPNFSLDSLNKLAEVLNDYPLALTQAVSSIKHLPSLSIEDYLQLYQTKRDSLWKEEEQFMTNAQDQQKTVFSTFVLLLDQIKNVCPYALQLLKFSSFLGSQDIPKKLLKDWMVDFQKCDELEFHKALSTLIKYSIFEKNEKKNIQDEYFNIHSLLHEFIRTYIKKEENEKYITDIINTFSLLLPESSYQMRDVLFENANLDFHLNTFLDYTDRYEIYSNDLLRLKIKHLYYTKFTKPDYYENDLKKFERLKSKIEYSKISDLEKARFLIISSNIVTVRKNGIDEAIRISKEAESLLDTIDTPEAKEELFFLLVNHFMDFYTLRGNLIKAEAAGEKAKNLLPQIHNMNYVTLYYFMRAVLFLNRGDYEEALKHINASLEEQRSDDFPAYFRFYKNIIKCEILAKRGDLENAFNIAEENYKKLRKVYKKNINYKILKSESILAFIYLKQGKLENAVSALKPLLEKLDIFFHNSYENPTQGFSHMMRGEAYDKQGNYPKALEEYKKAEDVYTHIFKTVEVDDMSYLYKNLVILGEKMNDDFLSKHYLERLVEHFGLDHIRTIESLQYLDKHKRSIL
ncbi:MAG: hypothetical protein KBD90_04665 [Alphaproteobacteria bacterium]|nr:hypothetical protein [Alphaproteobacteria bacterium]